jgi:hypothetical protein
MCVSLRWKQRPFATIQKAFGIVTALIGFAASLISLQTYSLNCFAEVDNVELCSPSGTCVDVDFELGIGYQCLAAATFLKLIDFAVHVLTPTPPYRHFADTNTHLDPNSKNNAEATNTEMTPQAKNMEIDIL